MSDLDTFWSQMIDNAIENANADGREHVADFLRLRAKNDAIRHAGANWLLEAFITTGMTPELISRGLTVERTDSHQFKHGNSSLVGSQLRFQLGVRCLSVEVGWTRTPSDGIMRGGALAFAHVSHFGMISENEHFALILEEPRPRWRHSQTGASLNEITLDRHLVTLVG